MPFTPAHVAAVLPLRGLTPLPLAALAAGSMSPDLPYFLPLGGWIPRNATHSLWGVLTWNLGFGLGMWLVWRWLSPTLHDIAPDAIRRRWRLPPGPPTMWWTLPVGVMLGSATHVLWDAFTHAGHFGSTLDVLAASYPSPLGPLAGYRWLQYASGVLGLVAVLWIGWRQPTRSVGPQRQPLLAAVAPVVIGTGALLATAIRILAVDDLGGLRALAFLTATSTISGAGGSLLLVCAIHAFLERRSARSAPQSQEC